MPNAYGTAAATMHASSQGSHCHCVKIGSIEFRFLSFPQFRHSGAIVGFTGDGTRNLLCRLCRQEQIPDRGFAASGMTSVGDDIWFSSFQFVRQNQ
jgi:hypothetical protein